MRSFFIHSLIMLVAIHQSAMAQCSDGISIHTEGASSCLSAVRNGKHQKVLFTCKKGEWTDAGIDCPDRFAYFCQVGPHAITIGTNLLLGTGPTVLKCEFPGVLKITEQLASQNESLSQSRLVRNIQQFLSKQGSGVDCFSGQCSGRLNDATTSAITNFLKVNFSKLTADERKEWGFDSPAEVEKVLAAMNPIDIVPLFITTFDVPDVK